MGNGVVRADRVQEPSIFACNTLGTTRSHQQRGKERLTQQAGTWPCQSQWGMAKEGSAGIWAMWEAGAKAASWLTRRDHVVKASSQTERSSSYAGRADKVMSVWAEWEWCVCVCGHPEFLLPVCPNRPELAESHHWSYVPFVTLNVC